MIKADDFSNLLIGAGICNQPNCLPNLHEYFKLSKKHPDVLVVKRIINVLVELSENEELMTEFLAGFNVQNAEQPFTTS